MNSEQIQMKGRALRSEGIIPQEGPWKFVRVDGLYRWMSISHDHSEAVAKNEVAESAGMIAIGSDEWVWLNKWSMTLKIGADDKDQDNITKLLRKPLAEWSCE